MRRPPPKPVPDPPLPHGAEGPGARDVPEEKRPEQRQFVKMPPASIGSRIVASGETQPAAVRPEDRSSRLNTSSGPQYQMRSSSEVAFPELFAPVDSKFWHGLSDEQRLHVTQMQATAMERVGFEPDTQKFFIDVEMDDSDLNAVLGKAPLPPPDKGNELSGGGNWIGGGVLLGMGLAALALGVSPLLSKDSAQLGVLLTYGGALGMLLGGALASIKVK
jgi:hypothetical protein